MSIDKRVTRPLSTGKLLIINICHAEGSLCIKTFFLEKANNSFSSFTPDYIFLYYSEGLTPTELLSYDPQVSILEGF